MAYDPVSSTLVSGSTYLHGPNGEVIGQADYDASGQRLVTRYRIWLDSMPLDQVELNYTQGVPSGAQLVFLHSDHLNAPRLASTHQGISAGFQQELIGSGTVSSMQWYRPSK
ncbi:hypothetical protein NUH87_28635 [Pseudomonas batumici]|uniref:hypothetical protein n=1 Tax=Pseudomonas batumici TaxID=226910 RepID=UPI0030CD961C